MSLYLGASVIVALLTVDTLSERADQFMAANRAPAVVSDLAAAEFASAISRRVRMRESSAEEGRTDLSDFDLWLARSAESVEIAGSDVAVATTFLRRLDLPLLTPDAIHIAIAQRLGATLVTFDRQMAANAGALGSAVAMP